MKKNKILIGYDYEEELEDALYAMGAKLVEFRFEDVINPESDMFDEDIYNACCDEVIGEYRYPLLFEFLYCDLKKETVREAYREIISRHENELKEIYERV